MHRAVTHLALSRTGERSHGARSVLLVAALLLGVALVICLVGPLAAAGASPASGAHVAKAALESAELSSPPPSGSATRSPSTATWRWSAPRTPGRHRRGLLLPARRRRLGAAAGAEPRRRCVEHLLRAPPYRSTATRRSSARWATRPGRGVAGRRLPLHLLRGHVTQWQKMTAPDGVAGDKFGSSVSLSGDTALIGAPYHDVDGKVWQGAAYVFVANRPVWAYQAELTGADGVEGDQFSASVSLSGATALVGARNHRPVVEFHPMPAPPTSSCARSARRGHRPGRSRPS